jgi:hypothetical protein
MSRFKVWAKKLLAVNPEGKKVSFGRLDGYRNKLADHGPGDNTVKVTL